VKYTVSAELPYHDTNYVILQDNGFLIPQRLGARRRHCDCIRAAPSEGRSLSPVGVSICCICSSPRGSDQHPASCSFSAEVFRLGSKRLHRPPVSPRRQSSLLQIQRSRVRFPALPDFLTNSRSSTGSIPSLRINEELLE
jgi:hypothetical protein